MSLQSDCAERLAAIQTALTAAKESVDKMEVPDFSGLNLIRGRFAIKVRARKYVGYKDLETCAKSNEVFNYRDSVVEIPDTMLVETDGILWSIRPVNSCDQG